MKLILCYLVFLNTVRYYALDVAFCTCAEVKSMEWAEVVERLCIQLCEKSNQSAS